jgi:hypothetical protein
MDNHYHLLLDTPAGNLSQIMHHVNGAYTTSCSRFLNDMKTNRRLRRQVDKIEKKITMCNVETPCPFKAKR